MGTFVAHAQTMNVYKDLDHHYDLKLYDKRQHLSLIRGFFEYANLKCVNANMDKSFPPYITVCFHLIAANASGAAVLVRTYMFQISMTR